MAVGHKLLVSVIGRKKSHEGGGITRVGPRRKSEARMAFKRRQTTYICVRFGFHGFVSLP